MSDLIALFDMDGTLFDYEGELRLQLRKLKSTNEPDPTAGKSVDIWDFEKYPWFEERIRLIKKQPGFWRNLPRFKYGWDVYHFAKKIGYDIHILTKGPSNSPSAWAEKVECIRNHFDIDEVTIHLTEDKGIQYGRVLVDDYPVYIERWLEHRPRGLVIMPGHRYNEDFSHSNVIRYNGENSHDMIKALRAAAKRKSNEHWLEYA